MAIKDVESKCWILALFVRNDGERFLLGDGNYEFNEKQLHFAANTIANDVVEVQGNDGYLLAGQVRRPSAQSFDGYVGDSSTSKAVVEQRRRAFFEFFRKGFFYKVVYVFPDGSAIQRKRGFLVDAPEVKELYQIYPEYHVALNFEDINYYYYDEDASGQEIYGESATIRLNSGAQGGGLVWLPIVEGTLSGEGTNFTLFGTVNGTALTSAELKGNTTQQTYNGKNLFNVNDQNDVSAGTTVSSDGFITQSGDNSGGSSTMYKNYATNNLALSTSTTYAVILEVLAISGDGRIYVTSGGSNSQSANNVEILFSNMRAGDVLVNTFTTKSSFDNTARGINTAIAFTAGQSGSITYRLSVLADTSVTPQTFSYEPYVGGTPAPNPDYPQEVQTVTGRQVVDIYNKNLFNKYTVTTGYLVERSSGTLNANASYSASDFIPVVPGQSYTFSTGDFNYWYTAIYDANKQYLGYPTNAATITIPNDGAYIRTSVYSAKLNSAQFELGSTATSYQTHQSYEVNLGKNLFNVNGDFSYGGYANDTTSNGDGTLTTTANYQSVRSNGQNLSILTPNTAYIISAKLISHTSTQTDLASMQICTGVRGSVTTIGTAYFRGDGQTNSISFTTPADTSNLWVCFMTNGASTSATFGEIQLEVGSTATTYAPYFEPIELCKIGTYQDYIYKSGDDWYLHKMIDKVLLGSLEWYSSTTAQSGKYRMQTPSLNSLYAPPTTSTELASIFCTHYVPQSQGGTWNCNTGFGFNMASTGVNSFVYDPSYNTNTSASSFKTWLTNNNVTLYYALATPTDTKITDTTLIEQLNALAAATTYDGSTSFIVDGNGNLAATLSVEVDAEGGGGVQWDENGAVWEEGGSASNTIMIDSIDNVYPVLTITGRTVNPVITDVTTGLIFQYTGTITESQTLVVDMMNKTATLNGVSVVGNVTGDWLYLAPGSNRITYVADNTNAPNATLEWQEIVG